MGIESTLDPGKLADWKAKHGELHLLDDAEPGKDPTLEVVVRLPTDADYRMFKEAAFDDEGKKFAGEQLFQDCIVYPEPAAVLAHFARRPFARGRFVDKLLELAGSQAKVRAKKL
ncbi:MAG TPA: hypothetical protein VFS43_15940 [Polyangiaceae bacterium]|nr:hypothetical protein [Polyangiaceae bacterium]